MRVNKKAILAGLREMYPDAGPELHFQNPYETLVAVMLSAQCTDKQVNKVTPALFERYPDVKAMAGANVDDVYQMVKSCGFKSKAGNIVESCRLIMQRHGGEVPGDMKALTAHVFRVSNRLGLADAKNVEDTEEQLKKAIPKKDWVAAHHWLIFHGRRVCHARNPECGLCPLCPLCKAAQASGGAVVTPKPKKKTTEIPVGM